MSDEPVVLINLPKVEPANWRTGEPANQDALIALSQQNVDSILGAAVFSKSH
jgi:hypothetical protein